MVDLETLKWRLAETIQWCTPRANIDDPKNSLRSPELDPDLDLDALDEYWCKDYYHELNSPEEYSLFLRRMSQGEWDAQIAIFQTAMAKVVTKRAQLLRKTQLYPTALLDKLNRGRLLLYFPGGNTRSGEVPGETQEFFDYDDVPPWDTWVGFLVSAEPNSYYNECILCWIPPEFEYLVDCGVGVCMLGSIAWADERDRIFCIEDLEVNKLLPVLEALLAQLRYEN